jgi:sulfite reductase (NADPH) flavoprotein alpha-component
MTTSPIPKTAPFAEDEIEILNRVVGTATPLQRAWLAGFLAGIDASSAAHQTASELAPAARPAEPLTIVFASESGNSERLAADMAKAARKQGFKPTLIDMADLDVATLAGVRRLVVIAATWGEGEPPARATHAYNDLMGDKAPRLDGVSFAVLALGDTAYVEFCAIGKAIDARLAALGGNRIAERADLDLDFAEPAARWIQSTLTTLAPADRGQSAGQVIEVDFSAKESKSEAKSGTHLESVEAEVSEHINLNSSRSDKQTIHLELAFADNAPAYEPGDSLDLFVENNPVALDQFLKAVGLTVDNPLRLELASRDINTLSLKTLETFVAAGEHPGAKVLLASGEARQWIAGRQLIDLFEAYPTPLTADQIRSLTRPLAPRAYSIASSRREVGDEAHLLVSPVRYESHGRARAGVASTYVADRLKKGGKIRVKLRPNRHFRLPAADRDIIMVGPGTGIAPFRAFVQERRAIGATGRSWLFFGDRRFTHDFLYQLEWQDALADHSLTRMDVAFSRDRPQKLYVQDKMWEHRRDLVDWLDNGAFFYVCGDAKAMAKDVRDMLVRSYADVKALPTEVAQQQVAELERQHRYLQDVY